jgi:uncharacterized protein
MILVDANLLLYAYDPSSPQHVAARNWLEATLSKSGLVGFSWVTLLAFLRIGTNPRALEHPLSVAEAEGIVSEWLERPTITVLNPGDRHWDILRKLLTKGQVRGPLVTDAHLAALAIEHGAILATTDRDFARFPGLKFFNPLDPA